MKRPARCVREGGNLYTQQRHGDNMQSKLSYVHGAHDVPLIGDTIGVFLKNIAARHGDNDALVVPHQDVRWTYRDFDERVTRLDRKSVV